MKKVFIICVGIATLTLASCGSSKNNAQSNKGSNSPFGETYEMPCAEYDSDSEFGATGIYKCSAAQKGNAQQFALQNAQQIVRMKMQHAYKGMVSDYTNSYGNNAGNDIQSKITIAGDQAINTVLNDTRATCVRFSGVDDRGNIECYVGIRISKELLAKKITERVNNALSQDEKMRIDFNEKKYREEMKARFKNFKEDNNQQ